jgi:hypothetical protein
MNLTVRQSRPHGGIGQQESEMTENMNQDRFNMSVRKFLKQLGVTGQREIERVVEQKGMQGKGKLTVRAVITAEGTDLHHVVEGEIDLG